MKRAVMAVVAVGIVAGAGLVLRAQDAAKVDAKHYSVVIDNDQVRVLKVQYGPGEKSVMHSHPAAVAVFLTDGKVRFHAPDGKSEEAGIKAGTAMWTEAQTHLPENIGDKPLEVMVIELKKPAQK
jgi:quercetin dioxygenase-like cupin family protein